MKRSKHLETLSWEHHDGLVLASRLKKGVAQGADANIMADYTDYMWAEALTHHFDQEEKFLLPKLPEDMRQQPIFERMLTEHRKFAALMQAIQKRDNRLPDLLKEFADLLEQHIRFEERELFPFLEKNLGEKELEEIGASLHRSHKLADKENTPIFWK